MPGLPIGKGMTAMTAKDKSTRDDPNEQAFRAQLPELLKAHSGKFALFAGGALVDTFDTFEAAYNAGVDRAGLGPFFVGRVTKDSKPEQAPALQHGLLRVDF